MEAVKHLLTRSKELRRLSLQKSVWLEVSRFQQNWQWLAMVLIRFSSFIHSPEVLRRPLPDGAVEAADPSKYKKQASLSVSNL